MTALAADLAAALDPVAFAARLGFVAEPWQAKLLRSTAPRVLVACARQVGKTTMTAIRALHTALYVPESLVLIIAPAQAQSDELLRRVKKYYEKIGRPEGATRENMSELTLENGSRILSLPGTENTTRGFAAARLLIIDEASRVDDEIFEAVYPMVSSSGAIWALSTPEGQRGWFYRMHQDGTGAWERHKATVYESAQYDERRIAGIRSSVGSYRFASDFECVFGDTETQMFSTALVRRMVDPSIEPMEL